MVSVLRWGALSVVAPQKTGILFLCAVKCVASTQLGKAALENMGAALREALGQKGAQFEGVAPRTPAQHPTCLPVMVPGAAPGWGVLVLQVLETAVRKLLTWRRESELCRVSKG